MQNRYFGDVGDFVKYGLLRKTAPRTNKMGILWCLTDNETHNNDGKHISYLKHDSRMMFRECDPDLFDALKRHLIDDNGEAKPENRHISLLKKLQLLPENTVYYEQPIQVNSNINQREEERDNWFSCAFNSLKDCDLVFCDPDNGIEVPSASKRTKKHLKYIFWDELHRLWNAGISLIIYQHMNMCRPHIDQANTLISDITDRLSTDTVMPLRSFRGTVRTFFLVPQPSHKTEFAEIYDSMTSGPWLNHVGSW